MLLWAEMIFTSYSFYFFLFSFLNTVTNLLFWFRSLNSYSLYCFIVNFRNNDICVYLFRFIYVLIVIDVVFLAFGLFLSLIKIVVFE